MKKVKNTFHSSLIAAVLILALSLNSKAETLSVYDSSFTVLHLIRGGGGSTGQFTSQILSGRWGIWDDVSKIFTQTITSTANRGYVETTTGAPELAIEVNQTSNSIYTVGTALALAIFSDNPTSSNASALNYASAITSPNSVQGIFTNPNWTVPTFNNNAIYVNYLLDANTVAQVGTFNFNGGNQTLTLIPEPTSSSLLLVGVSWVLASYRRRKVSSL